MRTAAALLLLAVSSAMTVPAGQGQVTDGYRYSGCRWNAADIAYQDQSGSYFLTTRAAARRWNLSAKAVHIHSMPVAAWIVTAEGGVVTRDLSNAILPGVTRRVILKAAAEAQIPVEERKFTLDEAYAAREAFITAATLGATAVVALDGRSIGDGTPGPLTRRIQELYRHATLAEER